MMFEFVQESLARLDSPGAKVKTRLPQFMFDKYHVLRRVFDHEHPEFFVHCDDSRY
jgi:hypothetical protein